MKRHISGNLTLDRGHITDEDGNVIASVPYNLGDEQDRANATRLVHCWNSFDELLVVCKRVLTYIPSHCASERELLRRLEEIAKAEGRS